LHDVSITLVKNIFARVFSIARNLLEVNLEQVS
jgi:hypothetical protein